MLRITCCLLLAALLFGLAPAYAGNELISGDYIYTLADDGSAVITRFGGGGEGKNLKLTIPNKLDGHPVTVIGSGAFSNCKGLLDVTLPDNLTAIQNEAFNFCKELAHIWIPSGVKSIGYLAFLGAALEAFDVDPANKFYQQKDGVLFEKASGMLHTYPKERPGAEYEVPKGTKKLGMLSFRKCNNLRSILLPDSLEEIEVWAFAYCSNLQTMAIPKGVSSIGYGALEGSSISILTVDKENLVYSYTDGALYDKSRKMLHTLLSAAPPARYEIAKGTLEIGACAFGFCEGLEEIIIPDSMTTIGSWAFRYSGIKNIVIPHSVTTLEESAFYGCNDLTGVTLSAGLDRISGEMFSNCGALEDIIIPPGLASIEGYAFYRCEKLKNVIIPPGVTQIGAGAFFQCGGLQLVQIPDSVVFIGSNAFDECGTVVLSVKKGSYAQEYAVQNNIPFEVNIE